MFEMKKKDKKTFRKLLKIGLILALIFWLLCLLLNLLNDWNMEWNKMIRLITEQGQIINSLEMELENVKAHNTVLDWRLSFAEAELANQNKMINDMAQTNNYPSWSSQGVISIPQIVEIEEVESKSKTTVHESLKVFNSPILIPATIAAFGKAAFTIIRYAIPVIP